MAQKNALQSVMDVIRRGATKVASATPVGQLVSRLSQAPQPLRVPSMGELENAYTQSVGRVSSFVQKNPTPVSFAIRQAPQISQSPIRVVSPKAYQTFQENVRLLSQPLKSLTTETPAARLLFEKIGGPAQYAGIEGKPTVGKYIAGTVEGSLPGLLPLSSGPNFARNILREGINVPAALRSGAGLTAFNVALSKLKGERITPGDVALSFGFGSIFGATVPSPMNGIAVTELGNARKLLSKYGFELKDYENSVALKTKFRKLATQYAPRTAAESVAGHPKNEEWKAIVDAWNKTTSAGIKYEWRLPDIMGWVKNLWTKKQQPKGTSLLPMKPRETATEQLFGKVADVVRKESGIGSHIFEGPQIRTVLKKIGLDKIPEGTIESPGFIVQYIRRDPVTGQPIVPRLVVNVLPEEQVQSVAPQVVQPPSLESITPKPQATVVPPTVSTDLLGQPISQPKIKPAQESLLPVTGQGAISGDEALRLAQVAKSQKETKGIEGTPMAEEMERAAMQQNVAIEEPASPALLEYLREMRRTVNIGELEKLKSMSTAEANKYVQESITPVQPITPPSTVTTGDQMPISETKKLLAPPKETVAEIESYLADPSMDFNTFRDMYGSYAQKYNMPSMETYLEERNSAIQKELEKVAKETRQMSVARIPEIAQFAPVIRSAVGIWRLHRNKPGYDDIATITNILAKNPKYQGSFSLDSALEAIRTYANKEITSMEELAKIVKDLPMPKRQKGEIKIGAPQAVPATPSVISTQEVEAPKSLLPELPSPRNEKEKIRGFVKSVLESDVASEEWKKKIIQDVRLYYEPKGMAQSVDEAEKMIREDPQGTLARVIDLNQRSDALNAAGQILMVEADALGNHNLANQIHDVLAEKATLGGRETNIWKLLDKLSPTGRVQYSRKIIQEIVEKLSTWDQKVNKIHYLTEAPKISEDVSREMNAINREAVEVVAQEVTDKFQKLAQRLESEEKSAEELLGKRIVRRVKSLTTTPNKKDDPIVMMVNTLYRVALEVLPKNQKPPADSLSLIAEAIKDKEGYREVWELAQEIVKEKFADKPNSLELLDDYFAAYLNRPFAQNQLNQVVARRIKENKIDIAQTVRDYYVEAQHQVGETLATRLSNEAGLTDEDARMLEGYVTKRFDELTSKKKEQMLTTMMRERPKLAQRTFLQRILDLSNLGAFNQGKYYDLIAKKLNIPNVSEQMAKEIYKKTQELQALPVDSEERGKIAREVMDLISDQVPPGIFDIFDAYRYQNLLSNPRTFLLRNPFWNLLEATTFVPAELALETSTDYLRATLFGKDRQLYASIPAYYKGLINAIPNAIETGKQVWSGSIPIENPDIKQLKMRALQKKYSRLTVVPRIMEIGDQVFRTLISQAYSSALQAKGISKDVADEAGVAAALDALLRRKLDVKGEEGRGPLITGLDVLGNALLQSKKAPFWGNIVSGIAPFISTPLQYAEMTLEYTPLFPALSEIASRLGGQKYTYEQKRKQSARAFIGLIAMGIASAFATNGKTTWNTPDDEKERQAWYDAKMKPYSVKIGNAWIPFQLFGPLFLSLAIPAAIRHYYVDSKTAMTDTMERKTVNMLWGLARAYTDLTFLSSIGDFFSALEGNYDSTMDRWMANVLSQWSPLIGFTRYLSILVDPTYRKSKGFWEALQKNYPFATKHLEPYRTLTGEESKRNFSSYTLPYDIGIENPEARFLWNQRHLHLQQGALMNQIIGQLELPEYIQKGTEEELNYINDHPETSYGTLIRSLKSKFDSLGRDEFKTYSDKQMSVEEKNTMYENIQTQKQEILDQVDSLWKEVLKGKGEKVDSRNMFDVVEAAEVANDFRDIVKRVESEKPPMTPTQYLDQIKDLGDQVEKYKRVRQFFDLEADLGKFTFDRAKAFAQRTGIDPQMAEYDYWTSQEIRKRKLYTLSQITDLSGNDLWNALVSLRKESPGTGNMVLTNEVINDLIDEGYLTKSAGSRLKKVQVKTNANGKTLMKISGGTSGGTKLSDLKKISSLIEQRNKAVSKAMQIRSSTIKIPKIKLPKMPKVKTISSPKLTAPSSRFVLKLPKVNRLKQPKALKNIVYARRPF